MNWGVNNNPMNWPDTGTLFITPSPSPPPAAGLIGTSRTNNSTACEDNATVTIPFTSPTVTVLPTPLAKDAVPPRQGISPELAFAALLGIACVGFAVFAGYTIIKK